MDGKFLKGKIKALGVSFSDVARELGMSPQHLNNVFRSPNIKVGLLKRIAEVVNVNITYFFAEEPSNNSMADMSSSAESISGAIFSGTVLNDDGIGNSNKSAFDTYFYNFIKEIIHGQEIRGMIKNMVREEIDRLYEASEMDGSDARMSSIKDSLGVFDKLQVINRAYDLLNNEDMINEFSKDYNPNADDSDVREAN